MTGYIVVGSLLALFAVLGTAAILIDQPEHDAALFTEPAPQPEPVPLPPPLPALPAAMTYTTPKHAFTPEGEPVWTGTMSVPAPADPAHPGTQLGGSPVTGAGTCADSDRLPVVRADWWNELMAAYKYADLAAITQVAMPILGAHGLTMNVPGPPEPVLNAFAAGVDTGPGTHHCDDTVTLPVIRADWWNELMAAYNPAALAGDHQ